jgi:elongation factor P--(R)-beta-lysine ligase
VGICSAEPNIGRQTNKNEGGMTDEWWRPDRFALRRGRLEQRARILAAVRGFFAERGFAEVDTPALQVSPGLEPHLQAFATELHSARDGQLVARYLHTSPEYAMKKLLAAGLPRIWQLAHVFRDNERSATHHPEFSMLEWYRAGASYRDLMEECAALVRACQEAAGTPALTWRGRASDARQKWRRISVAEAFRQHCGIDLLATAPIPDNPDIKLLAAAARGIGIAPHSGDDWETLFFRIFLERIEPHLGLGAPAILYDYPVSMAALSRRRPDDPRLAERFEIYVCGLELANAFGELTDPVEQRTRFLADQARKQALYGHTYPIDEDFLAALEQGLPACAGIALGFDRLVMLATAADDIEEVLWAPVR